MSCIFHVNLFAWNNLEGGDHGGEDWIISTATSIAGIHTHIGLFRIYDGAVASVESYDGAQFGHVEIYADQIDVRGTLSAVGSGFRGGNNSSGEGPGRGGFPCFHTLGEGGGGAGYGGEGGTGGGGGVCAAIGGSLYGSLWLSNASLVNDDIQMGSGGGAAHHQNNHGAFFG